MSPNSNYGSIESQSEIQPSIEQRPKLKFLEKIGYSLGHIYNDLGGAVWSGYTLLFMHEVREMSESKAGIMLMFGQVCGAFATPVAGALIDKFGTKRKWHILGTILLFLSFTPLFSICPFCDSSPWWWQYTYYGIMIFLFQIIYSLIQVTHLAMIPELSKTKSDRGDLTAMRQSATILGVIIVYAVSWIVLHASKSKDSKITRAYASKFRVSWFSFPRIC